MPRVGTTPAPPRAVPIRLLSPNTRFRLEGSDLAGIFLDMIGEDAKVILGDARQATYWSGESPVFRNGEAPAQVHRQIQSGPSRAEKREAKVKIERIMARPVAAPAPAQIMFGVED